MKLEDIAILQAKPVNRIEDGNGYVTTTSMMFDDSEKTQKKFFDSVNWEEYGNAIETGDYDFMSKTLEELRK